MNFKPLTQFIVGGLLLCVAVGLQNVASAQADPIERFDRVAVVTSVLEKDRKLCTGFFVAHRDQLFLLTTKHSALETNVTTEVALPAEGPLRVFRLVDVAEAKGTNPWTMHGSADIALCKLDPSKLNASLRQQVELMSIPLEQFDREIPPRTQRIEAIGFPMGMGVTAERLSPLVTTLFAASKELNIDGSWGKEAVFFASPSGGAGTSGGIVTTYYPDPLRYEVVGVYMGFNADNTGAKLSRILPAHVVVDFVETQSD